MTDHQYTASRGGQNFSSTTGKRQANLTMVFKSRGEFKDARSTDPVDVRLNDPPGILQGIRGRSAPPQLKACSKTVVPGLLAGGSPPCHDGSRPRWSAASRTSSTAPFGVVDTRADTRRGRTIVIQATNRSVVGQPEMWGRCKNDDRWLHASSRRYWNAPKLNRHWRSPVRLRGTPSRAGRRLRGTGRGTVPRLCVNDHSPADPHQDGTPTGR